MTHVDFLGQPVVDGDLLIAFGRGGFYLGHIRVPGDTGGSGPSFIGPHFIGTERKTVIPTGLQFTIKYPDTPEATLYLLNQNPDTGHEMRPATMSHNHDILGHELKVGDRCISCVERAIASIVLINTYNDLFRLQEEATGDRYRYWKHGERLLKLTSK